MEWFSLQKLVKIPKIKTRWLLKFVKSTVFFHVVSSPLNKKLESIVPIKHEKCKELIPINKESIC